MLFSRRAYRGMAVSPHHLASEAGRDVLREGGNAVEAAVAIAAALAVVYPHMTGIGGDAFWLVAEPDGRVHAIDASGRAARQADLSLYPGLDSIPWRGPRAAITAAGAVSAWAAALESSPGRLPLSRILADAIHYAENGTAVTASGAETAAAKGAELRPLPGAYAHIFEPDGRPLLQGERLRQPALAQTLRRLASEGLDSFYRGALARDLAGDLAALGSPVSAADLLDHAAARPRPLQADVTEGRLYNMTPPTQGLASLLILSLFDRLSAPQADSFAHVHGLIEATKQAFMIRDAHVGDPAGMTLNPQALLDDAAALDTLAARIDPARALPWPQVSALGDTTWFAAADAEGRVVSAIQSLFFEFGSGVVLPQTGVVWQNRGCAFRLAPGGCNSLTPGRKPFHTLNPALARLNDGRLMAYGTMGGEGQPQTQAAIFTRYARYGVPLQAAITAPRWLLGRTWGEASTTLKLESRFEPGLIEQLRAAGHDVEILPAYTSVMGHAGAIVRHADGGLEGAFDPRSDGAAAAW